MNRSDKKQRQRQEQQTSPEIKQIEYAPLVGSEDIPPSLASEVVVAGGTDTITLTFYYISPNTLRRAYPGPHKRAADVPGGPNIEVQGERLTIRSAPIARVALPLSVVADLMAEIVDTVVGGIPSLQDSMVGFANRLTESIANAAQSIQTGAGPQATEESAQSEGMSAEAASKAVMEESPHE